MLLCVRGLPRNGTVSLVLSSIDQGCVSEHITAYALLTDRERYLRGVSTSFPSQYSFLRRTRIIVWVELVSDDGCGFDDPCAKQNPPAGENGRGA